jgi:molecular chaperone DnaK
VKHPAIGIDLGTTYCAVAMIDEFGKPKMLLNRDGNTLTPSVVHLDVRGNAVIGEAAKNGFAFDPENTALFFKINMGEPGWTKLINGNRYDATRLSAYLLRRLKEDTETEVGQNITKAVVTVPAYFSDSQRVATKQAAEIAGLEVLQLVNEPTAAAIDYARETTVSKGNRTIFVFDLGGGTLDATILKVEPREFGVVHTHGLHDLGGIHWDELIVDMIRAKFQAEHRLDISKDAAAVAEALGRAETAKKTLSQKDEAMIQVGVSGKRVSFRIKRTEFEEAAKGLVAQCKRLASRVLQDSGMVPSQIDEILLVGGATRMPMIKNLIRDLFSREPVQSTRVDESVARGAAYVAFQCLSEAKLALVGRRTPAPLRFTDVSSHSLGAIFVKLPERVKHNSILIPRFSALPAAKDDFGSTLDDAQRGVVVEVTEGESTVPDECNILGSVTLPIPQGKSAGYRIAIRYEYDRSGILRVVVSDPKTGVRRESTIHSPIRMSQEEVLSASRELALVRVE